MMEEDDVMAEDWTYAVDILPYLKEPEETDSSSLETFTSDNGTDHSSAETVFPHMSKHSVSSLPPSNGFYPDHTPSPQVNFRRSLSAHDVSQHSRYSRDLCRLSREVEAICIQRDAIRIGRVLNKAEETCVCYGTFRTACQTYGSHMQPASIHIATDLSLEEDKRNFLLNMATIARLKHVHVAKVIGACVHGDPQSPDGVRIFAVLPKLCTHVNLHTMLTYTRENNPKLLSVSSLLGYAEQICKGIEYLQKQKILHKNLRANTCLIDDSYTLQLSEIHVRPLNCRQLDIRWLPLEVIQHRSYTTRGLSWTVGIVLWELMSLGLTPYPHLNSADVPTYLFNGKRLIKPDGCCKQIYSFMCECWKEKPRERITVEALLSKIKSYKSQLPFASSVQETFKNIEEYWEDEYI